MQPAAVGRWRRRPAAPQLPPPPARRMNPIAVLSGAKQWTMAEGPNGQLLGCGRLRDIEAQAGGAVELSSLVVAEEARGQGLGSQLLAELLRRAGEREVRRRVLACTGRIPRGPSRAVSPTAAGAL